MPMLHVTFVPVAAIAAALLMGACGTTSPATSQPPASDSDVVGAAVEVSVGNYAFEPSSVEVGPGARVVWTVNEGTHEVVATGDAGFDSGPMSAGNTFTWSPDFSGSRTVAYECRIHPDRMTGTIQVNG